MSNDEEVVQLILLENPAPATDALLIISAAADGTDTEVYLVLVLTLLLLLVVVEDDKGTVPVGSNPLDLFRLASGHPDALYKNQ